MKLCLVVKTSDGTVIDDVFIEQVKSGYLMEGFQVDKDSFEFEPLGRCHNSICHSIDH